MTFFWTSPFGPVALLAIGGLLLIVLDRRLPPRRLAWASFAIAGLAWVSWLLLRLRADLDAVQWLWSPPLSLPTSLQFHLLPGSWLAGLIVLLVAFVFLALPGWSRRPGFVSARVWVLFLAAQALLVLLAGNWLTLLGLWVGLVLLAGLAAGGAASVRAWSYGVLGSLFLISAPLFNGGRSLEASLDTLALNLQAQFLVILAVAITLAAYPFHLWLLPSGRQGREEPPLTGQRLAAHLVPALAALYLLGLFDLPLLATQAWAPLGTVALLGSAVAAWAEQDEQRARVFLLVNRCAWALLVVGLAQTNNVVVSLLALLSLGLGASLWALAGAGQRPARRNWPLWLAAAVWFGLPFTPGFVPTLGLASLAGTWIAAPGWLVLLLAQGLFIATFFSRPAPAPAAPAPADLGPIALQVALAPVAGAVIWYALAPQALASLLGASVQPASAPISVPLGAVTVLQWLTLLLSLALGGLLLRSGDRWFGAWRSGQRLAASLAGLEWLAAALGRVSHLLRVALSFIADLVDGAGQFGWVILVVLVAWLLLRG